MIRTYSVLKAFTGTDGSKYAVGNTVYLDDGLGSKLASKKYLADITPIPDTIEDRLDYIETEARAVSVYSSEGVYKNSYATIDLACAGLATGDILKIVAGEHTLTAAIDIKATNCVVQGAGKNVTSLVIAAGAAYMFKTVFGAISSTKSITFNDVNINHADDSTSQGILIENTSATGRINLYLNRCSFESDDGDSLHVDHAAAGAAIRVYANDCEFEGPVNYTVKNTDDRIRFERCYLAGGLVTSADDIAMEIALLWCKVLHAGVTGGHVSQLLYSPYCISATGGNPEVYKELDTSELAGSHTESLLFPTT